MPQMRPDGFDTHAIEEQQSKSFTRGSSVGSWPQSHCSGLCQLYLPPPHAEAKGKCGKPGAPGATTMPADDRVTPALGHQLPYGLISGLQPPLQPCLVGLTHFHGRWPHQILCLFGPQGLYLPVSWGPKVVDEHRVPARVTPIYQGPRSWCRLARSQISALNNSRLAPTVFGFSPLHGLRIYQPSPAWALEGLRSYLLMGLGFTPRGSWSHPSWAQDLLLKGSDLDLALHKLRLCFSGAQVSPCHGLRIRPSRASRQSCAIQTPLGLPASPASPFPVL